MLSLVSCRTLTLEPASDFLDNDGSLTCPVAAAPDTCSYYRCLERNKHCGFAGYPLGYGERYCERFRGGCDLTLTSDLAKQWVRGTTKCLQQSLLSAEPNLATCAQVQEKGFGSHTECYTDGAEKSGGVSFCRLSPFEWKSVSDCISFRDKLSLSGLAQIAATARHCAGLFVGGFFLRDDGGGNPNAVSTFIGSMTPEDREKRAREFSGFASSLESILEEQTRPRTRLMDR
jgi:hypothetical protein